MALCLRELFKADLSEITRWRNQPEAVGQLGSLFCYIDGEVDIAWFNSYLSSRASNMHLAVCDAESTESLSLIYLLSIDWRSRRGELLIWILEVRHRGRGVGSFAMLGILRHAFHDLNLHAVWPRVLGRHDAAIALHRRFHFEQEDVHRDAVFKGGSYQDMLQMPILAPEFSLPGAG